MNINGTLTSTTCLSLLEVEDNSNIHSVRSHFIPTKSLKTTPFRLGDRRVAGSCQTRRAYLRLALLHDELANWKRYLDPHAASRVPNHSKLGPVIQGYITPTLSWDFNLFSFPSSYLPCFGVPSSRSGGSSLGGLHCTARSQPSLHCPSGPWEAQFLLATRSS